MPRRLPAPARWRDQGRGARAVLAAVLTAFALLTVWNLGRAGEFVFYGAAVRSATLSWHALAFGAFDPAATVTIDKLTGFLVPQALVARVTGYSASALALPQVAEGLVTVWCCGVIGLRLAGRVAGLAAAAGAAATPIFVSMFGRPMEDGLLTMALAVAVTAWQRAVLTGAAWPLAVSGLFVGVGFQAKMLQAWLVLPALVLGLVLTAGSPARRAARIALLLGAAIAASLVWITAMQLAPGRPVVDGAADDDLFTMVFGYNGVDRIIRPDPASGRVVAVLLRGAVSAQASHAKLLLPYYTTQIGWLYPAALAGLALAAVRVWRRRGTRAPESAALAAVVIWLVTAAALLSAAGLPHTAYVAAIGVQLAVLAGFAVAEAVRLRASPRSGARLVLPVLALAQGAWSVGLAVGSRLPVLLLVLLVLLVLLTAAGATLALAGSIRPRWPALAAAAVTVVAVAGGATWSLQVLDPVRAGTGVDAYVGVKPRAGHVVAETAWRPRPPSLWEGPPRLAGALRTIERRTRASASTGDPLFATDAVLVAAPVIEATGREVLTDGGYSGRVRVLDERYLARMVASGRLHWAVTAERRRSGDAVDALTATGACARVESWPARRGDAPLAHGLILWRCGA